MKSKLEYVTEEIANCPIYKTLELFQGKWNIWILFELSKNKTMRFSELKRAIPGISNTMLTPPHVEYSATKRARELRNIFDAMAAWGEKYAK